MYDHAFALRRDNPDRPTDTMDAWDHTRYHACPVCSKPARYLGERTVVSPETGRAVYVGFSCGHEEVVWPCDEEVM